MITAFLPSSAWTTVLETTGLETTGLETTGLETAGLGIAVLAQTAVQVVPVAEPDLYQGLLQSILQAFPKVLWAIGILLLTRFIVGLVGRLSRRVLFQMEATLRKFFVQVTEILTLVAGILAALNVVGIQTTTIVAMLGAAGLAVGLALQNTLSHFAAGVMLISFRPFEVGDAIEGAGVAGLVDNIGLFSTTVITPDNTRITVPNSNLFSGTLKNFTSLGTRRVDIEVPIGDRPIEPTITQLLALLQSHPLVLDNPPPTCATTAISLEGTVLSLRPWCAAEAYEQVRSEIQKLVQETLVA
jgi:small conductance mechanosensitive channel